MHEYLFSYGTLQKEDVQLKLFGRLLRSHGDVLKGYRLSSIEIMDEAFLSKGEQKDQRIAILSNNKNDSINGMVLEMSATELLLIDQYEPIEYKRIKVKLESGKESWVYAGATIT